MGMQGGGQQPQGQQGSMGGIHPLIPILGQLLAQMGTNPGLQGKQPTPGQGMKGGPAMPSMHQPMGGMQQGGQQGATLGHPFNQAHWGSQGPLGMQSTTAMPQRADSTSSLGQGTGMAKLGGQ